ncbi:DUF805 domain-containing protein [Macrococcus equipercicus]|uniref:DUF805 domain-containing protein n=1 Tax=Macrococcus equipercicus TaxID=69967 RepID=A0A9Q9F2B6_9STAP|nr:DUF805 domain-containing protein [Macrococcus equipercicus]UTH14216.1 hypothetical protein KFV11_02315 [Macrococcus equipercicus]
MKDSFYDFWLHAFSGKGKDSRFEYWFPALSSIAACFLITYLLVKVNSFYNNGEGLSIELLFIFIPLYIIVFAAVANSALRRFRDVGLTDKNIMLITLIFNSAFLLFIIYDAFTELHDNKIGELLFNIEGTAVSLAVITSTIILMLPTDFMLKKKDRV